MIARFCLPSVVCSTHCSPVNASLPNPRTIDGYTLRQNWSATLSYLLCAYDVSSAAELHVTCALIQVLILKLPVPDP